MMRIVAEEVKLDILSPHMFRLYIIWENGIAVRPDVAVVWRGVTPNTAEKRSEEEDNILRLLYLERSQIELMSALPNRSRNRIGDRANVLGVKRPSDNLRSMYHRTVICRDLEAIMQQVESDKEKARVCQVVNKLAKQTMRGSLSAHWWLPLEMVSLWALTKPQKPKTNCSMSAHFHV